MCTLPIHAQVTNSYHLAPMTLKAAVKKPSATPRSMATGTSAGAIETAEPPNRFIISDCLASVVRILRPAKSSIDEIGLPLPKTFWMGHVNQ